MSWLSKAIRSFTQFVSRLWDEVEPKVRDAFEDFAEQFTDIALEEISKQALLTISGQQKLGAAADAVMERAKSAGWTLARTAAITLVQNVYAAQKAKLEPLVAPPNDPALASLVKGSPIMQPPPIL